MAVVPHAPPHVIALEVKPEPIRTAMHKHAVAAGHRGGRADAYITGAMMQRSGMHHSMHRTALQHAASAHGYSGPHADAYAQGAANEAAGMHAQEPQE
jgi:hypothetical protein